MAAQQVQSHADGERAQARARRTARPGGLLETLGLGLVAIIIGGFALNFVFANLAWERQALAAEERSALASVQTIATALGVLGDSEPQQAQLVLQRWVTQASNIRTAVLARPGGAELRWPPQTNDGALLHVGDGGRHAWVSLPVRNAQGVELGTLSTEYRAELSFWDRAFLFWTWGLAASCTLVVFVFIFRRLRRQLQPLVAIERGLVDYEGGLECALHRLTLSASLGSVAVGWNRLVAQLADLQKQVREASGRCLPDDVMRRYEGTVFRRVIDRLPHGALVVSAAEGIRYANVAAAGHFGKPPEELVGQPLTELVDSPTVHQALTAAHAGSDVIPVLDHTRTSGDQESMLRFRIAPLADTGHGTARDVLVVVEDVSQLRAAERARDNFLYHVTHELRTPLTNIHAYTETLTQPGFDDEQTRKECYNVIISETQRLSNLVETILSVSQLEVGTARLDVGEVDLVRLLRQMVQDHLGAADEKSIELSLSLPPKVPKIRGDKQRLCVLMSNLIGNAIKYTPEKGSVRVELAVDGGRVRIAVADSGIGIAATDQPYVFDKFYRAADERVQMITGTGLGLALAREVARLHGGDIELQSEVGQGSTFTVVLPAVTSDRAEVLTQ